MYYTYIIRCKDNSLYTGITNDLERRFEEHISKSEKCAKYTYVHSAIKLEIAWQSSNKSEASKLEYHIKRLSKIQKEHLINNNSDLDDFFNEKFDCSVYQKCDLKT